MASAKRLTGPWAPQIVIDTTDVASNVASNTPQNVASSARKLATSEPKTSAASAASNTSTKRAVKSREKRNLGQLNVLIPLELLDEVRLLAHKHRRTVADTVEQAIYDFVASYNSAASVASNVLMINDDDAVVEKSLNIINHQYAELLGKQLSMPDRMALVEFMREHGPVDESTARAGIAMAMFRTKQKQINGVRYFFGPFIEAMELPQESRARYAEHCVRKMREKQAGDSKTADA